jgi:hypothetical protein
MKNKAKMKKLVISRETLAELDSPNLKQAAAAGTENTCPSFTCQEPYGNCQYSGGRRTCFTCDAFTCTTNYC